VEVVRVIARDPAQAADGAAIDLAKPTGLSDAAPLGDVFQDRFDLLWWQSGVEKRGPFALRESSLASSAAEHASSLLWAIATGHREISGSALAVFRALGIQAAEAGEVVHGAAPPVRSFRSITRCVNAT
jgi:hypothetical protein